MGRTIFNKAQLKMLNMMSRIKTDEELNELFNVISDYYAQKAQKEIDSLWDAVFSIKKNLTRYARNIYALHTKNNMARGNSCVPNFTLHQIFH